MNGRIKILLAAYVNYPNAQNINCDNIAKHLDKEKFDVHVLYLGGSQMDTAAYKRIGITAHHVNPHRYLHQLTLWKELVCGNYDIYYMPKVDEPFRYFTDKFAKKRLLVSSVEGVITEKEMAESHAWYKKYMLEDMYDIFSISRCIADSVKRYYNRETEVLPLGVKQLQLAQNKRHQAVDKIVWVGSLIERKRPIFLLKCAEQFPQLQFTMIGDGDMQNEVEAYIRDHSISNVTLTGRIPNEQVYEHMQNADLLLMTSEFEGLPKVIQEAAQCGVPAIYMANNYTVDFIENGENGYGVYSLEEMIEKTQFLMANPKAYQELSQKAKTVISEYTWEKLIPKYEAWFEDVLQRYNAERKKR